MANQIRMTPDTMRSRAAEYRMQGGVVQEVIGKMDTLLQNLQGEWEGEASAAYAERYNELKPGFEKARELIEEIAVALEKTAQIVETTDSEIAAQFKA